MKSAFSQEYVFISSIEVLNQGRCIFKLRPPSSKGLAALHQLRKRYSELVLTMKK
jgi:hypothetical protein